MAITIVKDKDAIWETDRYDVILVGTGVYNMLTNGFQSKIRFKYPQTVVALNKTNYGDLRKLGKRVTIEGEPTISLMFICKYPHSKRVFIDYDALEHCLATANMEFKGKRVMTTMLGCTKFDGNGSKRKIMNIIKKTMKDCDLYIYDYEQKSRKDDILRVKFTAMNKLDKKKNEQLWLALSRQIFQHKKTLLKLTYLL